MVKFGLETQEAIDAFEAQFGKNYVPLSGIATDEETSFTSSYPTGGAGMSVFGPTTKRAEGRQSGSNKHPGSGYRTELYTHQG